MGIKFRKTLLYLNLVLFVGSAGVSVYTLIASLLQPERWLDLQYLCYLSLTASIVLLILYLIRKSRYPVAGMDYK